MHSVELRYPHLYEMYNTYVCIHDSNVIVKFESYAFMRSMPHYCVALVCRKFARRMELSFSRIFKNEKVSDGHLAATEYSSLAKPHPNVQARGSGRKPIGVFTLIQIESGLVQCGFNPDQLTMTDRKLRC